LLVAALSGLALSARDQRFALEAFLAAMALTLALSYAIWLGVLPSEDPSHGRANPAVFKLHITHGVLMALAAFLAADRALRASELRWRVLYGAGALLAAFNVLFMVQGRIGYLVLGVLCLYFCAAHWRWRGVIVTAAAATLALAAAYLAHAPLFDRSAGAAVELRDWTAGHGGDTSTGLRMNYYKTTVAIVREHPVLGVGTGGFVSAYREKIRGTKLPESSNPHNQYLLTAAQLGAVGLAALIAMFGVMWWQAGRLEPAARIAARGLVLTIAVGCLLNSFLLDHAEGLLFAWMAGVLFATPKRAP
jgi:O-antigen ligase